MLLAPEATLADGRYRLLETRAVGGMATVWLGHDERLDRSVAVKVISDSLAVDPDFVRRFGREARVAARLSHPNLVRLFDFGTEDGRPFLVSEWIDGPDLQEWRREGGPVDGEALSVDLLGAVGHIHEAGIVHRDVKPSNVLLDRDGRARLTDFGIAQPEDATRLTQTGMVMGTAPFIAPEALLGEPSTRQSDLYSVGKLLDYVLGDTATSRVARLIARLTAEDPAERPESAADALVLAATSRSRQRPVADSDTPLPPPTGARTEPLQLPTPRPVSPRARTVATITLFGALFAVAAALLLAGGGDETPRSAPAIADKAASGPATPSNEAGEQADSAPPIPEPGKKIDVARGAELNNQGFELINAGDYDKAVKVLTKAVSYFPAGTDDLNYAYALFNLGHALRLAGRPEEAIPVLEARLEIPNQSDTVSEELALAREQAGTG